MHRRKLFRPLATSLLLIGCAAFVPGPAVRASEPTVELRWALGAWDAEGTTPSAIKRDTQLPTGTRLKFLVEPLSRSTVYLILLDGQGELHVLYEQSAVDDRAKTYVPPGSHKFAIDEQSGQETFFLLASIEPLEDLASLLARHAAADPGGKAELSTQIVGEIRRLHKAHRQFARPVEKPVMIGGQTRGGATGASAIDRFAVEISAERFYGKTITIDH